MTLIACQTGADAWRCLEFEICFKDCQSDEFSGVRLIIQIIMLLLILLVEADQTLSADLNKDLF